MRDERIPCTPLTTTNNSSERWNPFPPVQGIYWQGYIFAIGGFRGTHSHPYKVYTGRVTYLQLVALEEPVQGIYWQGYILAIGGFRGTYSHPYKVYTGRVTYLQLVALEEPIPTRTRYILAGLHTCNWWL